ncbi:bestrophin-4-like [Linepithema humile]|uniref:bestrophin-4-like n=1 Tax=Linepithema humile TaxID=83485 RepID=UPI0006235155|nr:PREDICTED: bestrophin-4-like [Linepithema humile]XP_012216938.1 PREDICTED: bestrophin-4-like [Linepithema humile]XP_012216940.1 PREDICTED: bestrophin-4-like [Linepithema humile]XP_012216941.1 PREDICTED: bestrophin-4-like [Linepithema humile]
MTVSYQYEVASSTSGGFTRLLFMWRGSLYKLIYRELLLYLILFGILSVLYRHTFTDDQKKEFEQVVIYCDNLIKLIPLSFVLGFYVSYVAQRWWKQYKAIPWPDKVMHLVALYITGSDEYSRMLRRALMRYLNLSLILVLRSISSAVKRRFPTLDHVVDSGFMTTLELELYQSVPSSEFNTYWIPCTWFINLLKEARKSHRLPDAQGLKLIMEEFNEFRTKCGLLWSYDWVSIPLVYTQVVTLATYSFFAVTLIGRQYIDGDNRQIFQLKIDKYVPLFTILQFFFFMGLLKVAEQLINPFGDDDEDFELNWLIDRHTKVSYLGVDTLMNRCPPLVKDIFYDSENISLPYTEAAASYKKKTYRGSVANMTVPEEKQMMFLPGILEEEEESNNIPTPRTSTASLANPIDSPANERRQISGSHATPAKMARNCSETIVQLDNQEQPIEMEQRHVIVEAVKKFSSLAKGSASRIDFRKPFLPGLKSSKPVLQPWPSATNISHPFLSMAISTSIEAGSSLKRDSFKSLCRQSSAEESDGRPSVSSQDERYQDGVVNSAFAEERLHDVPDICDCDGTEEEHDALESDLSHQYQCRQACQELPILEMIDMSVIGGESSRSRINSCPKYLMARSDRSPDNSRKRKGIQWRSRISGEKLKFRRRTTDSIPTVDTILTPTRSSPNLSNLEEQMKTALSVKTDPSCKQEDEISKL